MRAFAFKASTQKLAAVRCKMGSLLTTIALSLTLCLVTANAQASSRKQFTPRSASLVMDASNGRILYARNADEQCYPASLTKVMTLYLLFGEMERGKIGLNTRLKVSRHASNQAPSRLGLKPGDTIRVQDAILALVTKSANDVAVVVGERLGGDETTFAKMMTAKAKELGMTRTRYMNASGLPNKQQMTTARDQATLARHIQTDFPQYYRYFGTRTFAWDGRVFKNHNHLLGKYAGISGLKTGYTAASGFNLTTSVQRNGRSVIGVVLGGKTSRERDKQMVAMLDRTMPKAVVMRNAGNTQFASNEPAPTPITKPDSEGLNSLVSSLDDPDPDEESYTGTEQVASLSAPSPAPLRPSTADEQPATKTIVTTTVAPPVATKSAAPLDQATAYALAALGKAEGPVRRVGRDIGGLIVTPALASEGTQHTAPVVAQRQIASASDPKMPSHGWTAGDPLIPDGSWVIQIGAYSDQGDAVSRIRDAMKAAPAELSKAVPVTIPVRSADNKTLYRSRFGGFDDEKEARNACGRLARQSISCIAIPPANWALPQGSGTTQSARG